MSITVPLYGFGGSGSSGAAGGILTVTAPSGATVTVSKDDKTKTKIAGSDGVVVFKGLTTGTWNLSITNGVQTASRAVEITADYSTTISFFMATIEVACFSGNVVTCSDGVSVFTATSDANKAVFVVPNAGTWTVSVDYGDGEISESADITENGSVTSLSLCYVVKAGVVNSSLGVSTFVATKTTSNGVLTIQATSNTNFGARFGPIDMTNLTKATLIINTGKAYANRPAKFTVCRSGSACTLTDSSIVAQMTLPRSSLNNTDSYINAGTYELDISNFDEELYVMPIADSSPSYGFFNITNIILS